jgi:uncharacterized membrane protein
VDTNRSLSGVFQDILRDVQEIVRSEVNLAKAEIRQEASKVASSTRWIIGGAVTGLFAVLFLLWALVYAIALVWPLWAAALLVAALLSIAAAVLLLGGIRRFKQVHPTPERTLETIKENVEWVKQSGR